MWIINMGYYYYIVICLSALLMGHCLQYYRGAEGNGNPLQCSGLENPRDGGACRTAVYGVAQSRTRLKQLSSSSCRGAELNRNFGGKKNTQHQIQLKKTIKTIWTLLVGGWDGGVWTQDLLELISGLSVDADSVTTLHVFPGPEAGPSCSVRIPLRLWRVAIRT